MSTLVLFLEEPSAREMLKGLLPRLLPDTVDCQYVVFEGKQDLEKQLVRRLRGWMRPDSVFVVLRDQDSGDCRTVKSRLVEKCLEAGRPQTVVRIACRELESWYLGDLAAVEAGLQLSGLRKHAREARFRSPDAVGSPAQELVKLTRQSYQKMSGSRAIGPHLSLTENSSHSFQVFVAAIRSLVLIDAP